VTNNLSEYNDLTNNEKEAELSKILLEAYEAKKLVEKYLLSKLEETQELLKKLYLLLNPQMFMRVSFWRILNDSTIIFT
jgi:inosine/xanthosine triphosphate pyrophosphatase family protein